MMAEHSNQDLLEQGDVIATADDSALRICWICFVSEFDSPALAWLHPCRCRGSLKWVHEACLQKWIDRQQDGDDNQTVVCPQCHTPYVLAYPEVNTVVTVLEKIDTMTTALSQWGSSAFLVSAVYSSAVAYGGFTVVQVLGLEHSLDIMGQCHCLWLLVALPSIPVMLAISTLIRWEAPILRLLRCRIMMSLFPAVNLRSQTGEVSHGQPETRAVPVLTEAKSDIMSEMVCSLILPTVATAVGNILFSQHRPLVRACLGAATYIGVKGIVKIFMYQKQYYRKMKRRVASSTETFPPIGNSRVSRQNNSDD